MRDLIIAVTIIQLVFPMSLFAGSKTVVVFPVHDGVSDNISDDLGDAFSKALARSGTPVVSKDKVASVVGYYNKKPSDNYEYGVNNEAASAVIRAKEHYYNFDYEEASAQIKIAIKTLEQNGNLALEGSILRDAYIVAGIIAKSAKGMDASAKENFRKALKLDPNYLIDEKAFPPSVAELFDEVRAEAGKAPTGEVSVETDPKSAEVFINGVLKGLTPVNISDLPEGNYNLSIRTNKYASFEKNIVVQKGSPLKFKEKLRWMASEEKIAKENILSSAEEGREQIAEGVRVADLLRVPKVIMIDADEAANGGGSITLRMVDRQFKAGHNPVVINYRADKKDLLESLTKATSVVKEQLAVNIMANPQKYLDPVGVGDPVLLGKRHKALIAMPAFWAILGGVLAATAGGATAAAMVMGGGDDAPRPATGSVNVSFK